MLLDGKSAYEYLENVIFGMTKTFRVVAVPSGLKIFAALATLIAIKYIGTVAIWRVAAKLDVVDVEPAEEFLKVELDLQASIPEIEMDRAVHLSNKSGADNGRVDHCDWGDGVLPLVQGTPFAAGTSRKIRLLENCWAMN